MERREWTLATLGGTAFGRHPCSVSSEGVFAGGGRTYCAAGRYLAELHEGRWTRIPAIGPDGHRAIAIEAGPDGALYLDFGVTLRGAFVRTLP